MAVHLPSDLPGYEGDSLNAIGLIRFERSIPVDDSISNIVYGKRWTPYMDFAIYNLSDSAHCYRRSDVVRIASSCRPPDVGGDIIVLDQYILLNPRVCISCTRHDTGVDYCRPVINKILMSLRGRTFEDVPTLVAALPIKVKE